MIIDNKNRFPFSDVLQKGLGRAFKYVKKHDKIELRNDLLNACLHNLIYDAQCESSRAEWLFELIKLTEDLDFYRENILRALPISDDFWDINQLYDLVLIWAKQGDIEAKSIIYQTFQKQDFNGSWLGGQQIIELDGIDGLIAVAEIVGGKLIKNDDLWEDNNLITQAQEIYGVNEVKSALEQKALNSIEVRAYLDAVDFDELPNKARQSNKNTRRKQKFELDYVIQKIEQTQNCFYVLYKFGQNASEDEIEQVFDLLVKETRKEQLCRYFWIFKKRQLPRLNNRLLDLAISEDSEIQYCAIAALTNYQDNTLRNLAIHLIKTNPQSIDNGILALFIDNYQSGDFKIIESVLEVSQEIESRHRVGMDLIEIIEKQQNPELINCSLWIYENTPCAHCRETIVKILIDSKQISSDILEECLQDASPDIKALVSIK